MATCRLHRKSPTEYNKNSFWTVMVRLIQEPDFELSLYDERHTAFSCNIILIFFPCFLSYLEELQYCWLFSSLNIFVFEKTGAFSFKMELHSAGFVQELIIIISTCLTFLKQIQIHPRRLFPRHYFHKIVQAGHHWLFV